jgi:hypothetical protein
MKFRILSTAAIGALFLSGAAALAQTTVIETTGAMPPDDVVTYVQRETVPSVAIEGDVTVGYTLPSTVELHAVPKNEKFAYTVVNHRRVIVEPSTRKVIKVIE